MSKTAGGLKAVAVLEGTKGILSLLVGLGLHMLMGKNLQQLCEQLLTHLHLNPASHLPGIFLHAAGAVSPSNVTLIICGAVLYAVVRFVEAYGLWFGLVWTEWFALLSGAIYLPFEVYEVIRHHNLLSVLVLLINLAVVAYMVRVLRSKPELQLQ